MKKVLGLVLTLAIAVLPTLALTEVIQPGLPVDLDKFKFVYDSAWPCGKLEVYSVGNATVTWYVSFLNRSQFLKPLLVSRVHRDGSREDWLDTDRDGTLDEYFTNYEALHEKYSTPCDILSDAVK